MSEKGAKIRNMGYKVSLKESKLAARYQKSPKKSHPCHITRGK